MKTSNRIILASAFSLLMAFPLTASAQGRQGAGRSNSTQATTRPANTPVRPQATKSTTTRPAATTVKPSGNQSSTTRPANTPVRPQATQPTTTRPTGTTVKPSGNQSSTTRPGSTPAKPSGNQTKPTVIPPANNHNKPNFNSTGRQPAQTSRPGNNTSTNPGVNRPGNPTKPGSANRPTPPSYRPDVNRPHNNFWRPNYRPPRPNGGFWGAPPVNIYRPSFFRPLPPPRPVTFGVGIPVLNNILGITFGSFIDLGINTLFNAGYNVLGYANNIIYLSNVNQAGYNWPEANVYYTDGLMSNTQFQYWTTYPSSMRFDNVYANLTRTYGPPVNNFFDNAVRTVSWWAGGGTCFITLQYGPGLADNGRTYYYTTLTYSDYY